MVKLHWSIHGRPELNVLHGHFVGAGPVDPASAQNIFNAASAALVGAGKLGVSLATTTSFVAVGVTDLRIEAVPETVSTGAAVPGTDAALALPDQVSLCLTKRTAKAGRSYRGRIYMLGFAVDCIDTGGMFAMGVANQAVTWVQAVMAAMSAAGMPLAISSPALPERPAHDGSVLPAKDYAITPVTAVIARDLIPDTNRRRQDLLRR